MTRAAMLLLALAAACGRGYRSPEDSEPLRRRIDDRNLETQVRMALARDPETAPYGGIRVRAEEGIVTLEGRVDRPAARDRAVRVARAVAGVRGVVDLIVPTRPG